MINFNTVNNQQIAYAKAAPKLKYTPQAQTGDFKLQSYHPAISFGQNDNFRPVKPYKEGVCNATLEKGMYPLFPFNVGANVTILNTENIDYDIKAGDNFIAKGSLFTKSGDIKLGNNASILKNIEAKFIKIPPTESIEAEEGNITIGNNLMAADVKAGGDIILGKNCTADGEIASEAGSVIAGDALFTDYIIAEKDIKLGNNTTVDFAGITSNTGSVSAGNRLKTQEISAQTDIKIKDHASIAETIKSVSGNARIGEYIETSRIIADKNINIGQGAEVKDYIESKNGDINIGDHLITETIFAGGNVKLGKVEKLEEVIFTAKLGRKPDNRVLEIRDTELMQKKKIKIYPNSVKSLTIKTPMVADDNVLNKFEFYDKRNNQIAPKLLIKNNLLKFKTIALNAKELDLKKHMNKSCSEKSMSKKSYLKSIETKPFNDYYNPSDN